MGIRPDRDALEHGVGGGGDDRHHLVPLIAHIGVASVAGEDQPGRPRAGREGSDDAERGDIEDRHVVLGDVGDPGLSFVVREGDHVRAPPRVDGGDRFHHRGVDDRHPAGVRLVASSIRPSAYRRDGSR